MRRRLDMKGEDYTRGRFGLKLYHHQIQAQEEEGRASTHAHTHISSYFLRPPSTMKNMVLCLARKAAAYLV